MTSPDRIIHTKSGRWQRLADRVARWGWLVLLGSVALALVGGVTLAVWNPETENAEPSVDVCETPPCFGGGGLPAARDLPIILPLLGFGLAIVLGLPGLLVGVWDLLRGRWALGGRRVLAFVGPMLIVVGTEIIPHLISPCVPAVLGIDWLPPVCERSIAHGVDVADRWHALDHALVGALPMVALYGLTRRRWRPDLASLRSA
jgi:hypothetical protein